MIRRLLQVYEHQKVFVGDNGIPADSVEAMHYLASRTSAFFTEVGGPHGKRDVYFKELVGVVQLPGGLTIEILPKISGQHAEDRLDFVSMIAETGLFPTLTGDSAQYRAGETLIETYLRFAANLAWQLLQTGISRRYIIQDRQSTFIRGQWLVARQLARSPMRVDRHELRVAEFMSNTPLNRLLKCGLRLMVRLAMRPTTVARLHAVVQMMDDVDDITASEAVTVVVSFDRLTDSWQPLYELVKQFLDRLLPTLEAGDQTRGLAWLFDMNKLFEAFVTLRLTQTLRPVRVHAQGPARTLARHNQSNQPMFLQRPDLVIGPADRPVAIADTKWKRLGKDWTKMISSDDVRQIYTYGRLYDVPEVFLIYPATDTPARTERLLATDSAGLNITIAEIPIRRGMVMELNNKLRELIHSGQGAG